jgi:hypothetical protein
MMFLAISPNCQCLANEKRNVQHPKESTATTNRSRIAPSNWLDLNLTLSFRPIQTDKFVASYDEDCTQCIVTDDYIQLRIGTRDMYLPIRVDASSSELVLFRIRFHRIAVAARNQCTASDIAPVCVVSIFNRLISQLPSIRGGSFNIGKKAKK